MPKNNNIQTISKQISQKGTHVALGSSVAAGQTRYVTMVRVTQTQGSVGKGTRMFLCSAATSDAIATGAAASVAQKFKAVIPSAVVNQSQVPSVVKSRQSPMMPDTENPLFTIASSKFLVGFLSSVTGASSPAHIFAQYYDQ